MDDSKEKIQYYEDELHYKNLQIDSVNSKLNLKDAQIKNIESILINRENEINNLHVEINQLKGIIKQKDVAFRNRESDLSSRIGSLEDELAKKEVAFRNRESDFINELNSLKSDITIKNKKIEEITNELQVAKGQVNDYINQLKNFSEEMARVDKKLKIKENELNLAKNQYLNQLSELEHKEYCIDCYEEKLNNNHFEIQYLKKNNLIKKVSSHLAYLYLISKSNRKDFSINFKMYNTLKNSKCFDIGYYLNNNEDIRESRWNKYLPLELHYVCKGFDENRKFNKKYFNRNSKKELLDYISMFGD